MQTGLMPEQIHELVDGLNFAQKVDRSLNLIAEAHEKFGDRLVVANSLGKDFMVVWHLAKRVSPDIRGFVVTTRYKPKETVQFMNELASQHPELKVFKNDAPSRKLFTPRTPTSGATTSRCCPLDGPSSR
jgi:3'-phosphoadenosine 5'-phosphosulfate sulfotransferase (PAPS reductase)/FAD synthetase